MKQKFPVFILLLPMMFFTLYADDVKLEPLHPQVLLKDNGSFSCAGCHDTQYIRQHSTHGRSGWDPGCISCHLKGGRHETDGRDVRGLIQRPNIANCKVCHPVADERFRVPIKLPDNYSRYRDITQNSGAIFSPQAMARSEMNLQNKQQLTQSWDVHAQRHLACNDCHFTANDPRHCSVVRTDLDHLIRDPRRIQDTSEYLRWPNHTLSTASCQCCHNPLLSHTSFPYLQRHLEALECESCHMPSTHTPAFMALDETVVTPEGKPRIEYRGIAPDVDLQQNSLNSIYIESYKPVLLSRPLAAELVDRLPIKSANRLAPFNLVTRWYWMDEASGQTVAQETVANAYGFEQGYEPTVLAALDRDGNGQLSNQELWLDTADRVAVISQRLKTLGVKIPVIRGEVTAHALNHGTVDGPWAVKSCGECHSEQGRLNTEILLTRFTPYGGIPSWSAKNEAEMGGGFEKGLSGEWQLHPARQLPHHYVFGFSRLSWIDLLGVMMLLATGCGILIHTVLRWYHGKKRPIGHSVVTEIYMYPIYERIWHWLMALGIVLLMISGLEIHAPVQVSLLGFSRAVFVHNVLAFVVVINGLLSLLYHLFTGEIRQFFGFNRHFLRETRAQLFYYLLGIFKHQPHPLPKTPQRKLNPLQQLTYLALLNVLLPAQIISGMLMWLKGVWPVLLKESGLIIAIAPFHYLGSWLLLIFLLVHLYLITTGHRPLSNLRAMISGYDEVGITNETEDEA